MKSGIFIDQGVRGVDFSGICGSNQYIKANYIEMATYSSFDKELVRTSLDRVFQTLAEHYMKTNYASLEIPEVGMLIIRNGTAMVQFQEGLRIQVRTILSRSIKERKERLESNLTLKNVRNLSHEMKNEQNLEIEEDAKNWLKNNLSLNVDDIFIAEKNLIQKEEENALENENLQAGNANNVTNEVLFESVSQRNYMFPLKNR